MKINIADIGLLEIYCNSNGKIVKSTLNPQFKNEFYECFEYNCDCLRMYINGHLDAREIVKYIHIPNGLKGLTLLAILAIPRGYVASYMQIAKLIGIHPRIVGKFAATNPIPVIIPCHRVVASNGKLNGYSNGGIDIKHKLLEIEGVGIKSGRVSKRYFVDDELLKRRFTELIQEIEYWNTVNNIES